MFIHSLSLLIFLAILALNINSQTLLGNYKLWSIIGSNIAYDSAGNSNHAVIGSVCVRSERGLFFRGGCSLSLPTNTLKTNPGYEEMVLSSWILKKDNSLDLRIGNSSLGYIINVAMRSFNRFEIYAPTGLQGVQSCGAACNVGNIYLDGWNFYTVQMNTSSTSTSFNIYINLSLILTATKPSILTNIQNIKYSNPSGTNDFENAIYEVWWHIGVTNISSLNYLFVQKSSCGCNYDCVTSPATICLPTYHHSMNYNGEICSTTCTSNNLTCDNSFNCVNNQKSSCQFGLYYSKSGECVYSCPDSSCTCSSDLKCVCNLGYKMISDNPPACIIIRCASYTILNDSYICDTLEAGYKLNNLGKCCDCEIGYTAEQTNPVICISNRCTSYDIVNNNYICHATQNGYQLDSLGNCCICDVGYNTIQTNPLVCVSNRCKYYYIENYEAICDLPQVGYQLDSLGNCCVCDDGYKSVDMNPLYCISTRCQTYNKENDIYICDRFEEGYMLDSTGECCTCEEGYTTVAIHPLVCIKIDNCSTFEYDGSKYICTECNDMYANDEEGTCKLCSPGFDAVSQNPLVCESKVERCYKYRYDNLLEEWACDHCVEGYIIDSYNRCDECDRGYLKYGLECKKEIMNCIEYNEWESGCRICNEGYELDSNNECTVCSLGYIEISNGTECALEVSNCQDYIYSPEFFTWKCQQCTTGYQLDSNSTCNICTEGYKSDLSYDSLLCIIDPSPLPNYNNNPIESQNITQTPYEAEIENTSAVLTVTALVSVSITSTASSDPSTLLLYLNTVKLISYIQKFNIQYPFEIRKQQSTCDKYLSEMNPFSYINMNGYTIHENMNSIIDDSYSFISSSIYYIMLLIVLFIGHATFYIITRYCNGKLKALGNIGLRYYEYDIYIQFYMFSFLDLFYCAVSKLTNVRYK